MEIKVITNSKENKVVEGSPLKVYVKAKPEDGKANTAVVKLLTKHYGKPVRIVSGHKSRKKVIALDKE